ncbi:MAG: M4 family metallopeptidase, partial [Holophagales bacterium]|nr:M4 family metallopeptidase [Holophagales bacterium]
EIQVSRERFDRVGWKHVTFDQLYRGIPVWGKQLTVHIDSEGQIHSINGQYMPQSVRVGTETKIHAADAIAIAAGAGGPGSAGSSPYSDPEIVIYEKDGVYRTAWLFVLPGTDAAGGPAEWRFFVDAVTGQVLDRSNRVRTVRADGIGLDCDIESRPLNAFEENGTFQLRDVLRTDNGGSEIHTLVPGGGFSTDDDADWNQTEIPVRTSQQAEVNIHYWLGLSYDRLRTLTGREGWDDQGLRIAAAAHFPGLNNARWLPSRQALVFGESTGDTFRAFGCANDIIAHEFMHGVIEFTAKLDNGRDANAMNESFADMLGLVVDSEDWLMGEGSFQNGTSAHRNIADPPQLGDPKHYDDISGNAHDSSNITSHAFFLAAEGLRHTGNSGYTCDVSLGRDTTFQHFFYTLENFLTTSSDMPELAQAVSVTATSILASGRPERADVFDEAFRRVGLSPGGRQLACAEPWLWLGL